MGGFFLHTCMQGLLGSAIVVRAYADTVNFSAEQFSRHGEVWGPHMLFGPMQYFTDRLIALSRTPKMSTRRA